MSARMPIRRFLSAQPIGQTQGLVTLLVPSISYRTSIVSQHSSSTSYSTAAFHPENFSHLFLRSYFTNTDTMKRDDPYAQLGLSWGDGATTADIKAAYRKRAIELHPDRNQSDSPAVALRKFQDLQRAYDALMKESYGVSNEKCEEWRFSVWRNGDRIALDRDDVAGALRKRPVASPGLKQTVAQLGHPSGLGVPSTRGRGDLLDDGTGTSRGRVSPSSVGRGRSKWVKAKDFKPWNGKTSSKGARRS